MARRSRLGKRQRTICEGRGASVVGGRKSALEHGDVLIAYGDAGAASGEMRIVQLGVGVGAAIGAVPMQACAF